MLFAFPGLVFDSRGPSTSADAAARSRRLRDAVGRYHSSVSPQALAESGYLSAPGACLFHYRIEYPGGRVVTGIVGEAPVADLLPHEETHRRDVIPAPPVEIRPLLAVSTTALPELPPLGEPVSVTEGPRRHSVTPVAGPGSGLDLGPLVLADGHHRSRAVARTFGAGARTMTLVVGDAGKGLEVGSFHRRFAEAAPLPTGASSRFEVEPTTRRRPSPGLLVWAQGSRDRYLLRPREDALSGLAGPRRRSAAAVAAALLYPLVGVSEAGARYLATADAALSGLGAGEGATLLPPSSMDTVLGAALEGSLLPPKATRFGPKPIRGLVVRLVPA